MSPFDHILVALIALVLPLWDYFYGTERMKRKMAEDKPGVRVRFYWETIGIQWFFTAIVLAVWFAASRSGALLGFSAPAGMGFWIGSAVIAAVIGVTWLSQIRITNTPERREEALTEINDIAPFIPRNRRELSHFSALSITAGICEEIVFRGYFIWYAMQFTGEIAFGTTIAVILSSMAFGIIHLYQGWKGMIRVFFTGLIFGVIYIVTGSLWVPMLAHAFVDISAGVFAVYLERMSKIDNSSGNPAEPDSVSPSAAPGNERGSTPSEAGC